jgi:hypothetical protein
MACAASPFLLKLGGGYQPAESYYIWVQSPADNSTRYTERSFVTAENGEIPSIPPATAPPPVSLPIEPNLALGTYLVSISNSKTWDSAIARVHYGIWGTVRSTYQRGVVETRGGGVLPSGILKVTIRNPTGTIVNDGGHEAANELMINDWKSLQKNQGKPQDSA